MSNFIICITCRLGSTRLPRKGVADVGGKPMIARCVERLSSMAPPIVVCTDRSSVLELNEALADRNCQLFVGDPDDVLGRMLSAAQGHGARHLVRVTGDNPLTDPQLMRALIASHQATGADYTYPVRMPRGTRSEVVTVNALAALHQVTTDEERRSDVSGLLALFERTCVIDCGYPDWSEIRLTVDYPADLEVVRRVYRDFGGRPPGIPDIVSWWRYNAACSSSPCVL